jgi:soluble lytic murein transglycosylase-like protein
MSTALAWGKKVSSVFRDRVFWIEKELGIEADYLMAAMAFESAETFRANIKNAAGSGATGLIQFMPSTARSLGTTAEKLALMTPEDQLNYVYKYFRPYKGRLKTLSDVYMAILWPKGVGQPESYPLFVRGRAPVANYNQNEPALDGVI